MYDYICMYTRIPQNVMPKVDAASLIVPSRKWPYLGGRFSQHRLMRPEVPAMSGANQ